MVAEYRGVARIVGAYITGTVSTCSLVLAILATGIAVLPAAGQDISITGTVKSRQTGAVLSTRTCSCSLKYSTMPDFRPKVTFEQAIGTGVPKN